MAGSPTLQHRSIPTRGHCKRESRPIIPGEKLKKDMYVTAAVNAGTIKNAIAVPDAAILRDNENQPFVYAASSSNQFGRRSVTVGDSSDGKTEITSGLKSGDRVIGDGSLFLQFANSLQR